MRIDIILESNNSPETVLKLGKLAEEVGLGGVWVSNMNDSRDPFINFVPLAMASDRIRLGPIAISPFELHPLKMASSLITLNEMAKGRAQIVVGAGGGTVGAPSTGSFTWSISTGVTTHSITVTDSAGNLAVRTLTLIP